eukprot:5136041-Prymnesium_polylepis.1
MVGQRRAVAERVVVVTTAVEATARVGGGRQMAAEAMVTEGEVVTVHSAEKGRVAHNHHNQLPRRSGCTQILAHRHRNHCRLYMGNGEPDDLIGYTGQEAAVAVAWDMGYSSTPVSNATAPHHKSDANRKLPRPGAEASHRVQPFDAQISCACCHDVGVKEGDSHVPAMHPLSLLPTAGSNRRHELPSQHWAAIAVDANVVALAAVTQPALFGLLPLITQIPDVGKAASGETGNGGDAGGGGGGGQGGLDGNGGGSDGESAMKGACGGMRGMGVDGGGIDGEGGNNGDGG